MNPSHQDQYRVRHSEGDRRGYLKLRALADYFQESAARHADELGCGLDYLRREGKLWVLSRLRFRIDRYPEIGERLTLTTYPRGAEQGLFARREYELTAAAGHAVAVGSSYWLLLRAPRLRPERLTELARLLPANDDRPRHFAELDKLAFDGLPELERRTVHESQIDVNGHLNNAEYFGFVADLLQRLAPGRPVAELQLNFLHALGAGEDVILTGAATPDGGFQLSGHLPAGGVVFQAAGVLGAAPRQTDIF